jgi:hypothetical protein
VGFPFNGLGERLRTLRVGEAAERAGGWREVGGGEDERLARVERGETLREDERLARVERGETLREERLRVGLRVVRRERERELEASGAMQREAEEGTRTAANIGSSGPAAPKEVSYGSPASTCVMLPHG